MRRFCFSLILSTSIFLIFAVPALADDPLIGEIRMWPAETPPDGWLLCRGQEVTCSANPDLCDVLGSTYGGDGETISYLPDFEGRFPVGAEDYTGFPCGAGSWCYWLGEYGGEEFHTLTIPEMPAHTHKYYFNTGGSTVSHALTYSANGLNQSLSTYLQNTGGGGTHNNTPLFSPVNFIIYVGGLPTPTPTHTPTATATFTPTATPTGTVTIFLPAIDSYTHTMSSGKTYTVPIEMSFGQIFVGGSVLVLTSLLALRMLFGGVYRS